MELQRKYFGTDGIRGKVGREPITPEFILKLGWAAGRVLGNNGRGRVLIGKDTRISGYMLESALEAGLVAAGIDIQLLGPMPTPAIAYLTRTLHADAGFVISASHNRYQDNGIKLFGRDGKKISDEIELAIEAKLEHVMTTAPSAEIGKASRLQDAGGRYIEFSKSTVSKETSLRGLTIVLDCANGATYQVAPKVLRELGAEIIDIAVDPDGYNINDGCGSTAPEVLKKTVLLAKADVGIAFDGDGDRVIMVDHKGQIIDGDELLFIIAKYYKALGKLHGGVVGTVMTNFGLETALKNENIKFQRAAVGDRFVLAKLHELNWSLGGESSGHIICLDKVTTGDGIVSALQVLSAMRHENASLHDLKKGMSKCPQVLISIPLPDPEINPMQDKNVKKVMKEIEKELAKRGRIVVRLSGTEPVIRLMVEGEDQAVVTDMVNRLADTVRGVL